MRYLGLTLLCDQIIKAIGLILRYKYVQKSKWGYTQASIVIIFKSVSKRSCDFSTVITEIGTFALNLGTSINNFQTTKYPLERSFWKKWDHKKKNFSKFFRKALCVLTFYKIYNIRKTSTSLLKYNTQHKVDLASSHYHDDNLFFLKDCSCLE